MFDDMIERIEDETARFLYFLQRAESGGVPSMPYPDIDDYEDDEDEGGQEPVGVASQPSREAQNALLDFTKNIQRKKDKEMADLQFIGGEGSSQAAQPVIAQNKVGRNDPCPCGSGKKYKKCHGA
jgi:preprotein translocase subunit SecA